MQVSRIDRDEFEIYLHRSELSLIYTALKERRANLRKRAANCLACGMEATHVHWLIEPLEKAIKEYKQSLNEVEK